MEVVSNHVGTRGAQQNRESSNSTLRLELAKAPADFFDLCIHKIVRWGTHDSSRRGLQRAFGALAAARADGPRHTPPPLERPLRKSGAVLRSTLGR